MCKSLELINQNGKIKVSSRVIALDFNKRHNDVVRAIENLTVQNYAVKNMFTESKFIHNKNVYKEYFMNRDGFSLLVMGFTGSEALEWKIKYINAFNLMEVNLINANKTKMSKELESILMLDQRTTVLDNKTNNLEEKIYNIENNSPLFNIECDELQKYIKIIVVKELGGKNSKAYKDRSIRTKAFKDIQREIKRQFGVSSYKAIYRKDFKKAKEIISRYTLPIVLKDEVMMLNNQLDIDYI